MPILVISHPRQIEPAIRRKPGCTGQNAELEKGRKGDIPNFFCPSERRQLGMSLFILLTLISLSHRRGAVLLSHRADVPSRPSPIRDKLYRQFNKNPVAPARTPQLRYAALFRGATISPIPTGQAKVNDAG
jgi:hypothetical protein